MLGSITAVEKHFPRLVLRGGRSLASLLVPDDVYLATRGLRTLGVRLAPARNQHVEDREGGFQARPEVDRVLYTRRLPEDPGHEIWKRDFTGSDRAVRRDLSRRLRARPPTPMLNGMEVLSLWGSPGVVMKA